MASNRPRKPSAGDLLGPYELLREIGRGGTALVFEAKHVDLARIVAIKVMLSSTLDEEVGALRFLREGRAACQVDHPNVVEVFDLGVEDGMPYLVMERLKGADLRALLAAEGPLSVPRALAILLPVVSAVAAAHDRGIVHRDLKPANVFVTTEGEPKVLDFGMSKLAEDEEVSLTKSESLLGTLPYMAPEQTKGAKNADCQSDQYALGVLLYEAITGTRPFGGEGTYEILHAIRTARLVPPSDRAGVDLPPGFETVLLRALDRDPRARHPSLRAFGGSLARHAEESARSRFAADFSVAVEEGAPKRARGLRISAAFVAALVVAGLAVAVWTLVPSEPAAPSAAPPRTPPETSAEVLEPAAPELPVEVRAVETSRAPASAAETAAPRPPRPPPPAKTAVPAAPPPRTASPLGTGIY